MARYALVIGISEYKHLPSPLSKTLGDAEAVANVLRSHGDFQEVILLNKPKLTKADLFAQLNRLLIDQAVGSEVVIYYTGHGVLVDDCGVRQGYLAPSDCKESREIAVDGIPFAALNKLIMDSQLSSLVVLLDCCHSGMLLKSAAETFTAFQRTDKNYALVAACRDFEEAAAMRSEAHSIFTIALLQGLDKANANEQGQINASTLFGSIEDRLQLKGQEIVKLGYGGRIKILDYRQFVEKKSLPLTQLPKTQNWLSQKILVCSGIITSCVVAALVINNFFENMNKPICDKAELPDNGITIAITDLNSGEKDADYRNTIYTILTGLFNEYNFPYIRTCLFKVRVNSIIDADSFIQEKRNFITKNSLLLWSDSRFISLEKVKNQRISYSETQKISINKNDLIYTSKLVSLAIALGLAQYRDSPEEQKQILEISANNYDLSYQEKNNIIKNQDISFLFDAYQFQAQIYAEQCIKNNQGCQESLNIYEKSNQIKSYNLNNIYLVIEVAKKLKKYQFALDILEPLIIKQNTIKNIDSLIDLLRYKIDILLLQNTKYSQIDADKYLQKLLDLNTLKSRVSRVYTMASHKYKIETISLEVNNIIKDYPKLDERNASRLNKTKKMLDLK